MKRNRAVPDISKLFLCAVLSQTCPPFFFPAAFAQEANGSPADLSLALASRDEKTVHEALARLQIDSETAKKSLPQITELLQWEWSDSSKFSIDAEAATLLGRLGQAAQESVAELKERARSPKRSYAYRVAAANALLRIEGPKRETTRDLILEYNRLWGGVSLFSCELPQKQPVEITRHLLDLTIDADPLVRERACYLLGDNESLCGTVSFNANDMLARAGSLAKEISEALSRALNDTVPKVQLAAAHSLLARTPERAEEIIPAVIAAVKAGEFHLKKCGTGAIPAQMLGRVANREKVLEALRPLLENSQPLVRSEGIDVLSRMPVQPQLRDWLKSASSTLQRAGAATSLSISPESHRYEGDLMAALKDNELDVRFAAAIGLVSRHWRGTVAPEVVVVLAEAIESTDKPMRLSALRWLTVIADAGVSATASLKRVTHDPDLEVRRDAALALVAVNLADAGEAVGPLNEALAIDSDSKILDVLDALARLGPRAHAAIAAVEKFYRLPDPSLYKAHAAMALAMIDPKNRGSEAVEVLAKMLGRAGSGAASSDRIVELLLKMGPAAQHAVPALIEQLNDPRNASVDAALAIVKIAPASAQPAKDWIGLQLAKGPMEDHVLELARKLPRLGEAARPLLPEMEAMLQSPEPYIRLRAAIALGQVGPEAERVLPALRKVAESDPNNPVKARAVLAITQIEKKK